jgi:hypothetical protein
MAGLYRLVTPAMQELEQGFLASSSDASFFSGSRAMPGIIPPTSQVVN